MYLAQTAWNAAATVTAAALQVGLVGGDVGEVKSFMETIKDEAYTNLCDVLEANPGEPRGSGGGSSYPEREKQVVDADTPLTYGKFKGLSIKQIAELDEAAAFKYGYGTEERPNSGLDWLEWVAGQSSNPKMGDFPRATKEFFEARKASAE